MYAKPWFTCLLLGCLFFQNTTAQQKWLRAASSAIQKNNVTEAQEKLDRYEQKNGPSATSSLLRIRLLMNARNGLVAADSVYALFHQFNQLINVAPEQERTDLCKESGSCHELHIELDQQVHAFVLNQYTANSDTADLRRFLINYPLHPYRKDVEKSLDSIVLNDAVSRQDIQALKLFIERKPASAYAAIAIKELYRKEYDKVVRSADLVQYRSFIHSYPNAPETALAKKYVLDAAWKDLSMASDTSTIQAFLLECGQCVYRSAAESKLVDIQWSIIDQAGNPEAYKAFIVRYPNAKQVDLANERLRQFQDIVLPFMVKEGLYRLYNTRTAQWVTDITYNRIFLLSDNRMGVQKNGLVGIVNSMGKTVIPMEYEECVVVDSGYLLKKGGKFGYVDRSGKRLINHLYTEMSLLNNSVFLVKGMRANTYGLLSDQNVVILDTVYEEIRTVNNWGFVASQGANYRLYDAGGVPRSIGFSQVHEAWRRGVIAGQSNALGIMDIDGHWVVSPRFASIQYWNDHILIGSLPGSNQVGLFDQSGMRPLFTRADAMTVVHDSLIIVQKGGRFGLIDLQGRVRIPFQYEGLSYNPFFYGKLVFQKNRLFGLLDISGRLEITAQYDQFYSPLLSDEELGCCTIGDNDDMGQYSFCASLLEDSVNSDTYWHLITDQSTVKRYAVQMDSSLIRAVKRGKIGFLNTAGVPVIPFRYDEVLDFCGHSITSALIMPPTLQRDQVTDAHWSIIDRQGNLVLSGYQLAGIFNNDSMAVISNGIQYHLFDIHQRKILRIEPAFLSISQKHLRCDLCLNYDMYHDMSVVENDKGFIVYHNNHIIYLTNEGRGLITETVARSFDLETQLNSLSQGFYHSELSANDVLYRLNNMGSYAQAHCGFQYLLGKVYESLNDDRSVRTVFRKLAELHSNSWKVLLAWSDFEFEKKNFSEYLTISNYLIQDSAYLSQAIRNYSIFDNRATIFMQHGSVQSALDQYSFLISVDSANSYAYRQRAGVYQQIGKVTNALEDYDRSLQHCKENHPIGLVAQPATCDCGSVYFQKGLIFSNLGNRRAACVEWQKGANIGHADCLVKKRGCR